MAIRTCPSCESRSLRYVTGDFVVKIDGHRVRVPNIRRQRCAKCGEELFDHEANQAMDKFLLSNPHFLAARLRTLRQARSAKRVAA